VRAEFESAAPYAAIPTDLSIFTLAATSLRGEPLDLFIQRKQNTLDQHDPLTPTHRAGQYHPAPGGLPQCGPNGSGD
jgi:hypothetical protein